MECMEELRNRGDLLALVCSDPSKIGANVPV